MADSVLTIAHRIWVIYLDGTRFESLRTAVDYLCETLDMNDREAVEYLREITESPNVAPTYIDLLGE